MKATEVFTPATLPRHTYNDREKLRLEWKLLEAVETPGYITSVCGPSKSGKTVLCETVVGAAKILLVTGGGVASEEHMWEKIRLKLGLPNEHALETKSGTKLGATTEIQLGLPGVPASPAGKLGLSAERTNESGRTNTFAGLSGVPLLEHVREQGRTLVIDDFHYIDRPTAKRLAEHLKEGARLGVKIIVISISHRSDEAIRANPDLRGRVANVDIPFWGLDELSVIADKGFPLLNLAPPAALLDRLGSESLTSPQLMQALCLQYCRQVGQEETAPALLSLDLDDEQQHVLLRDVARISNSKTAYDIIMTGPKPHGVQRLTYQLKDGSSGDIYKIILKAISQNPPLASPPYAEIKSRCQLLVEGDVLQGASITQALQQTGKRIIEKLGEDRVLEWDEEKELLSIPDPYFLYYLRWAA